jgi:hypothetical protein
MTFAVPATGIRTPRSANHVNHDRAAGTLIWIKQSSGECDFLTYVNVDQPVPVLNIQLSMREMSDGQLSQERFRGPHACIGARRPASGWSLG